MTNFARKAMFKVFRNVAKYGCVNAYHNTNNMFKNFGLIFGLLWTQNWSHLPPDLQDDRRQNALILCLIGVNDITFSFCKNLKYNFCFAFSIICSCMFKMHHFYT